MNRFPSFLVMFSLACAAAAQTAGPAPLQMREPAAPSSPATINLLLTATPPPLVLSPDDLILIQVYGVEAFKVRTRVERDGSIQIPLAGRISVGGMTVEQAQDAIRKLIQQQALVLDPGVTIDVLELPSATISITGEVLRPGAFPALGSHTLLQLIALGEGEKETASSVVSLSRPGLAAPVLIDLGSDPAHSLYGQIPIFSGDTVRVQHVGQAFVLGALGKQGIVNLRSYSPTTISEAISESGGIGFQASPDSARMVRTQGTERIVMDVHVGKILQGREPDIALHNDDILYVPTSATKAAIKGGAAGIIAGFATAFLYTR